MALLASLPLVPDRPVSASDIFGSDKEMAKARNPELLKLVQKYVAERKATGEWNNISAYGNSARLFSFVASTSACIENITRRQIKSWMAVPGLKPGTRAVNLSSVRGFFSWAVEEGLLAKDPTVGLKRPHVPKGLNRSLSPDQVNELIRVIPDRRGRLIVSLMLNEGLRRTEVTLIQMTDVDLRNDIISVRGKGYRGEASREVPLTSDTRSAILAYIQERGAGVGHLVQSKQIPGDPITGPHVGRLVSDWMRDAGIKGGFCDGISAHSLRHTAAEEVAEHATDLRQVQAFLGHSNLATTQTYLRRQIPGLDAIQKSRHSYLSNDKEVIDLMELERSSRPSGSSQVADRSP